MDWNQSSLNLQVDEGDRRIFRYNTPPNKGMQATAHSVRSAPASRRA